MKGLVEAKTIESKFLFYKIIPKALLDLIDTNTDSSIPKTPFKIKDLKSKYPNSIIYLFVFG